jgi:AraC family transcriptional regulator
MKPTAIHQTQTNCLPRLSHPDWEHIQVEQFQRPPGEGRFYSGDAHVISLSLAPRPVRLLQIQGDQTYTGMYRQGDVSITPAKVPFFARWDSEDCYLQIRLAAQFVQRVASETLGQDADRLELYPEFRTRDRQIEAIATMLLTELQQGRLGNRLYIESLANVLTVHLCRQYAATKPLLPVYEGGLPQRHLQQVLDYINDHLDQDIKLTDLAALPDMSPFHFSRLFKQSIGSSPYQYVLQQRIERAKRLLRQTDQPIIDIAFQCGFNSHSHLSKQFRHFTGATPKVYRAN